MRSPTRWPFAASPYIYATGYDETVIPERYSAASRALKPIDPRHVIDTLAKIIGGAR